MSPNVYEKFKSNEYELRNSINFEKIIFSNFMELNKNTIIDFKKKIINLRIYLLIIKTIMKILYLLKVVL